MKPSTAKQSIVSIFRKVRQKDCEFEANWVFIAILRSALGLLHHEEP